MGLKKYHFRNCFLAQATEDSGLTAFRNGDAVLAAGELVAIDSPIHDIELEIHQGAIVQPAATFQSRAAALDHPRGERWIQKHDVESGQGFENQPLTGVGLHDPDILDSQPACVVTQRGDRCRRSLIGQ